MFNILLDALPTEWNGYAINSDFRTGLQMSQASEDEELSESEKMQVMVSLLFKDKQPSFDECMECIQWFFNGWSHDNHTPSKASSIKSMDFDQDQGRIYSAFMAQYHINLNIADLHFWEFMILISNLEECAFTRVVGIRTKKIDAKMSKAEKDYYTGAKKTYAIKREDVLDEEEKLAEEEAIAEFNKYLKE